MFNSPTMRITIRLLPVFLSLLCGCVCVAAGQRIALASDGKANYAVVVPQKASAAETFAAGELSRYLKDISGASFPNAGKGRPFIAACVATRLPKLAPNVAFPPVDGESYGLFVRGGNIFLVGGTDRSVLYAVYDFLQQLGCKWVAPDFEFYEGKSRSIPRTSNLWYAAQPDAVQHPAMKYRKFYVEEGRTHNTENLTQLIDWMPKARFNILVVPIDYEGHGRVKWDNWREKLIPELTKRGIVVEVGGHGYQNFLNQGMENGKLFNVHPEWFGMDESGKRSPDPHRVFCTSNAEAVAYLQSNLLSYLNEHSEIDIFDFWPPDSERWCTCERCAALGNESDRHTLLVSQTAAFLRKQKPHVRVECIAYSHYVSPSPRRTLDPNVLVDFCPIRQSFEYPIYSDSSENNRGYRDHLLAWLARFDGDVSIYSYYRKYAWHSLPNIIPHYMQNDLRFYRRAGAKGISTYSEPGDWFTYGLNHFALAHLAWDPQVNVDSLTEAYCSVVYGKDAPVAVYVYGQLEKIVRHGCSIPHTVPKSPAETLGFADRLAACREKIASVCGTADAGDPALGHLKRLDLMLEYAEKDLALVYAKSTGASDDQLETMRKDIKRWLVSNNRRGVFVARE